MPVAVGMGSEIVATNHESIQSSQKPGEIREDGPTVYRCTQGVLFAKRSELPQSKAIVKLPRSVGSYTYSTGRIWMGPSGGIWCEMDAAKGEMGWMLVSGPGFGLKGPALVDAGSVEKVTALKVYLLESKTYVIFEVLADANMTMKEVKKAMCARSGLTMAHCVLSKEPPAINPQTGMRLTIDYMPELSDDRTIASCKFGESGALYLVYVGEFPPDFQRGEAVELRVD